MEGRRGGIEKIYKIGGTNEPLGLHKFILPKILTVAILLFAPAANMHDTSPFPIGCMK